MRCVKCGEKAAINMRQHKLALCPHHFLDWIPEQVERTIKRYHMFTKEERLLIAVSGGKDSLSLWDILLHLGYTVDGLYIELGIDEGIDYSARSLEHTRAFAQEHKQNLLVHDVRHVYGETIPQLTARTHRGRYKPCSVCGLTKRHVMNQIAATHAYTVLLTGHNLDDEAAILFGNTLNWVGSYIIRQGPVLEADRNGLVRKVKPLCRLYEREMAAYAILRGIAYMQDECPFALGSTSIYHKELLNKLESDRPGAKLSFYLSFLQAKRNGLFSDLMDDREERIHPCPKCEQPTTAPGLCAFCRMFTNTEVQSQPLQLDT
jgi:uncharacterized protein (TIGR00269 family)